MTPADIVASVRPHGDNLDDLNEKEMGFVLAIMSGKNATEAYKISYGDSGVAPGTIRAYACRMYHKPKIQRWLSAARQAHLGNAVLTRETHLREMERLRELSIDSGDLKSAVKAEEVRGYVAGLRIERAEITINNPAAILAEINRLNPKIAKQLAEQYAIPVVIEHEPGATDV